MPLLLLFATLLALSIADGVFRFKLYRRLRDLHPRSYEALDRPSIFVGRFTGVMALLGFFVFRDHTLLKDRTTTRLADGVMALRIATTLVFVVLMIFSTQASRPVPDAKDLATLGQTGTTLLATRQEGSVQPFEWPSAIATLEPERVYVTETGLYIVTSTWFVRERGLFVPRDPNFLPEQGTDPAYVPVREGVYAYRIEG